MEFRQSEYTSLKSVDNDSIRKLTSLKFSSFCRRICLFFIQRLEVVPSLEAHNAHLVSKGSTEVRQSLLFSASLTTSKHSNCLKNCLSTCIFNITLIACTRQRNWQILLNCVSPCFPQFTFTITVFLQPETAECQGWFAYGGWILKWIFLLNFLLISQKTLYTLYTP